MSSWGHTIKGEKKWKRFGSIVILVHDEGYVDHTKSQREFTPEELDRRIRRTNEKRIKVPGRERDQGYPDDYGEYSRSVRDTETAAIAGILGAEIPEE